MKIKQQLVILAGAFVTDKNLAGGDRLLFGLIKKVPANYSVRVILPAVGYAHAKKLKLIRIVFDVIAKNPFDNQESITLVFFAYLLRLPAILRTLLRSVNNKTLIYTSSDAFVDVVPAVLIKIIRPRCHWAAQLYHLVLAPHKRPGNYFRNLFSYLLQQFNIWLIKRFADAIFVDNPEIRAYLEKQTNKKLVLLGGSVDNEAIQKYSPQKKYASDAVVVSRLDPTKNLKMVCTIWKLVTGRMPHARLTILGSSNPDRVKATHDLIKDYKLANSITLRGYISHEGTPSVFSYLRSSKLFLFFETEGGRSLAFLEALAAGLPVVAGPHMIIRSHMITAGYMLAESSNQAAGIICNLLTHPLLRRKLSQKALQEAHKFSWDKTRTVFYNTLTNMLLE
jgi:glycosyltransferase involved in cell wall biosynthesis